MKIKREGEARERRIDQIASEVDGWQKRLDTAKSRMAELDTRRIEAEKVNCARPRANPESSAVSQRQLLESKKRKPARRRRRMR